MEFKGIVAKLRNKYPDMQRLEAVPNDELTLSKRMDNVNPGIKVPTFHRFKITHLDENQLAFFPKIILAFKK